MRWPRWRKNTAAKALGLPLLQTAPFRRWEDVFSLIADGSSAGRTVIVIDEFQYLGKSKSSFPSVLQRIWDTDLKNRDVMLILCGSLVSMMVPQTLSYSSPLYGLRTKQMRLGQIPFRHYHEFFPGRAREELIGLYSITGGVPKYIELFEEADDLYDSIAKSVLSKSSYLYDEPACLVQNEVSEVGSYFSIIRSIAFGNRKIGKIAADLGIKQTNLTKFLRTLIDLDILEREVPVTEESPEKSRENLVDGHIAFVYEYVCLERMWELNAEDAWPFTFAHAGRWWDNHGNEIDIVALDPERDNIVLGACKHWKGPVGVNVLERLEEKAALVDWHRESRREWFVLFSINGFTPELEALASERDDVLLLR